jgi:GNAT superfamily N-acetyltransferase
MGSQAQISTKAPRIRRVRRGDLEHVIALDQRVTNVAKPDYWRNVFARYGERDKEEPILGFIVGEIRAWEFGSAPSGWVFALTVQPNARLQGIGTALLDAIAREFSRAGVRRMRTMVARDSRLPLLFFRGEGMRAGPYIQLEKELE